VPIAFSSVGGRSGRSLPCRPVPPTAAEGLEKRRGVSQAAALCLHVRDQRLLISSRFKPLISFSESPFSFVGSQDSGFTV